MMKSVNENLNNDQIKKESIERSENIKKNIKFNLIIKAASIAISFYIFSLTFHYLDQVEYGIWATLFSITSWINFLDLGIGMGLRNKLARAIAKQNYKEVRSYISTGFFAVSSIGIVLLFIFIILLNYVRLQELFNTRMIDEENLYVVTLLTGCFVILSFVLSIINQIYFAYQKAAMTGLIQVTHNIILMILIFILTKQEEHNLLYFSISYGIALVISKISFVLYFFYRNKTVIPTIYDIDLNKVKSISGLGFKFFIMQICCLVGFSSSNILITQLLGPQYVRSYDVIFKVFSVITMIHALIMSPLWSAYTDAYVKKDFIWIKKILAKLNILIVMIAVFALGIGYFFDDILFLFLDINLEYSPVLLYFMMIYVVVSAFNGNYANILNGIGEINLQTLGWIIGASLIIPLSMMFVRYFNMKTEGVLLALICCMSINAIVLPFQVYHILKRN